MYAADVLDAAPHLVCLEDIVTLKVSKVCSHRKVKSYVSLNTPVHMHGGLICIAFCLSACLGLWDLPWAPSTVQSYVVHHQPALCSTNPRCAP